MRSGRALGVLGFVVVALASGGGAAAGCAAESSPLASRDEGPATPPTSTGGGADAGPDVASSDASDAGQAGDAPLDVSAPDDAADAPPLPDAMPSDAAPDVYEEPEGPPELRVLAGVADAEVVRICLVPWGESGPVPGAAESTTPELLYGASALLPPPAGSDPSTASLRPVVVGGNLAAAAGLSCASLVVDAPDGVRVAALPILPAGTLAAKRSLLLVAAGCLGGSTLADPSSSCGINTDPAVGKPAMSLVELSRVPPPGDAVAIQVVHASQATSTVSVQIVESLVGGTITAITSGLAFGGVAPRPPAPFAPEPLFGTVPEVAEVRVLDAQTGGQLASFPLGQALSESGLSLDAVGPGKGIVLALVGSRPGVTFDAGDAANSARVVILPAPALP